MWGWWEWGGRVGGVGWRVGGCGVNSGDGCGVWGMGWRLGWRMVIGGVGKSREE